MTDPSPDLVRAFDTAMEQIYVRAKRDAGYNATRFHQMLTEHGGVETARRLLPQMSDGFTELWQRDRLDLTVEWLILEEQLLRPMYQSDVGPANPGGVGAPSHALYQRTAHATGCLRLIAVIDDPAVVERILRHLGLSTEIPEARPARAPPTGVAPHLVFADDPA